MTLPALPLMFVQPCCPDCGNPLTFHRPTSRGYPASGLHRVTCDDCGYESECPRAVPIPPRAVPVPYAEP